MREPLILRRNWWQRSFSRIRPGSMRSSVFALVSSALGSGCLTIPVIMRDSGVVLGALLLALSAGVSLIGMNNITRAADHYRIYDYNALVTKKLGKAYGIFLDVLLSLFLFVCLIAYHLILYECAEQALLKLGVDIHPYKLVIRIVFTVAVVFPVSLVRRLSGMSYLSMLSMGCVLYIAIVVMVQMPEFMAHRDFEAEMRLVVVDSRMLTGFCIGMYAFICHMNVAAIFSEMQNPIVRKMKKANLGAVSFQLFVYMIIGVCGYMSCLTDTPGMFYQRPPPTPDSSDVLMLVAQLLVSVVVFVGQICTTLPCRHNCYRLVRFVVKIDSKSTVTHVIMTALLVALPFLLSIFIPEVIVVLGVLGAACTIFCNLFPAMLVASTAKNYWCMENVIQLGLAWLICTVGVASVVLDAK